MSEYAVAHLNDIDEITDGREPWRPVRHHFGITSFGINTRTARDAGDRIINEHDEEGEDEELYFVQSGGSNATANPWMRLPARSRSLVQA